MNIHTFKHGASEILGCEAKDETGLNDFQKLPSTSSIFIPKVGIERFRIPLRFRHSDGNVMGHDTEASMFIELAQGKTGANMSRFCAILQKHSEDMIVDSNFFKTILHAYRTELRDYDTEELIPHSYLSLAFNYAVKQPSLKSGNWGWQYYKCLLSGSENKQGKVEIALTVHYEYSSTCPCSLSMAKQYEESHRAGEILEGNGIATAHSQRSEATVTTLFDIDSDFWIDELIALLRVAIPTETQSLVKRLDEQAFAILNGENPMFVENVSRRLSVALDSDKRIRDWNVKIEHFESLHSHNAVAYIQKVKK